MAKFPERPTAEEKSALFSYIHLFARLYPWYLSPFPFHFPISPFTFPFPPIPLSFNVFLPIPPLTKLASSSGECASHFVLLLRKYPPQVASRTTAAGWACHVHNEVNKSLRKDVFDCSKIGDFYDCGCGSEEGKGGRKEERIELKVERTGG